MRSVSWRRRSRGRKAFPHAQANRHALSLTGQIGAVAKKVYDRACNTGLLERGHEPETFGKNINRCGRCFRWWTDALVAS